MCKKDGGETHLSELYPLQRLHPLQESFSLQNYSPTGVSYSTLPQCSKSTADRHPTRASAAGLQYQEHMGWQTWDLVHGWDDCRPPTVLRLGE